MPSDGDSGFDPYHKWLGIPAAEQPPDHYRLLGLSRFESDPDVIDAAASRQMGYLRLCATGPRSQNGRGNTGRLDDWSLFGLTGGAARVSIPESVAWTSRLASRIPAT